MPIRSRFIVASALIVCAIGCTPRHRAGWHAARCEGLARGIAGGLEAGAAELVDARRAGRDRGTGWPGRVGGVPFRRRSGRRRRGQHPALDRADRAAARAPAPQRETFERQRTAHHLDRCRGHAAGRADGHGTDHPAGRLAPARRRGRGRRRSRGSSKPPAPTRPLAPQRLAFRGMLQRAQLAK